MTLIRLFAIGAWLMLSVGLSINASANTATAVNSNPLSLQHQLKLKIDLASNRLSVGDQLRFSSTAAETWQFSLSDQFSLDPNPAIELLASRNGLNHYRAKQAELSLHYSGQLKSTPDCAWLTQACVKFDSQGVYLDANSQWYPDAANTLHTFELSAELPKNWVSLSQGELIQSIWKETQPQQAIYFLAGPFFKVYSEPGKYATALVYLQTADEALAKQYLAATHQYIESYSKQLGAYPYRKFATVESFWETGWGMPSFTLLGSKVMRLPFILGSSFPHEIVHNWWGNSVYVDSTLGNWSEGLTAYLADYQLSAGKGEAMNYRRDTLQKYASFTSNFQDFPLKEFQSRHDQTTQAIGYGKSLMLFHMLKQQIGRDKFEQGLQTLYKDYAFKRASFADLQAVFEKVSGQSLKDFFAQWLERTGAPQLALGEHQLTEENSEILLNLSLKQTQAGEPYQLKVPVLARFKDERIETQWLDLNTAQQTFKLEYAQKPLAVAVDPNFELLRIPALDEVPAALIVLYNAQPKTFVIARQVPAGMELAWEEAIEALSREDKPKTQYDDAPLPEEGIVILLGGDNAALTGLLERAKQPFKLSETAYTLNSVNYTCGLHSLALTLNAGKQQLVLLDATTPEALQQLINKLPHYGKYSYVLFNSASGENVAKGQWEMTDSPLSIQFKP
ncbi:MAG: M1 family aminopeptidase [Thiolinea sp.]